MYFRLKKPWAFRGWKLTPYAVQAQYGSDKHKRPVFFEKQVFLDLLNCNGEEDVDPSAFSPKGQQVVKELLAHDMLEQSEDPLGAMESWQRYHIFPARYMESVHWSITGKCNFQCRHCLVSAPDAIQPQLSFDKCTYIIHEIAKCGIRRVDITGGEPLVRTDFEEIVKELSRYGIDIGTLFTNASLLTEDTLQMMHRYHQNPVIQLSFDGLGHHDWLRGVSGAEAMADSAFRLLQKYDFSVSAAMCIHKQNKDSLRATADYLAGLGVKALRLNAPQALGRWKQYAEEYALSEDEVWEIYRKYIPDYFADGMPLDIELDGYFRCKKGETDYKIGFVHHAAPDSDWRKIPLCESIRCNMYIGPDGRVAPCMGFSDTAIAEKFPSVLEVPLGKLTLEGYYHDVVYTSVADYLEKNPECAACEYLPKCCGGCMLQDITDDGDYLVPDSRTCYFHKHIGEEAVREVAMC